MRKGRGGEEGMEEGDRKGRGSEGRAGGREANGEYVRIE